MANHKPLPAIPFPNVRDPTTGTEALSIDNRTHRGQLIQHIINEIREPGITTSKDEWVRIFEGAMDQLSAALAAKDWLRSVRMAKEAALSKKGALGSEDSGTGRPGEVCPENTIERVQGLASKQPTDRPSHLLICVARHGSSYPLPTEDNGFDLIAANIGCTFSAGNFATDGILIGLEGVERAEQLVGGTFTFKGLTSPEQHQVLSRTLRFAVYVELSMILEQHLLRDSHIQLKFPRPRRIQPSVTAREVKGRNSFVPQGLLKQWNLFTRKSVQSTPDFARGASLDLGVLSDFSPITRLRRFSMMGERHIPSVPTPIDMPFQATLKLVQKSRMHLSTSPGVSFDPPLLLDHLAEKEKENPKRRLKGDEKVGLRALLGWQGREDHGKGMSGLIGFIRHQEISVLVSQHVHASPDTLKLCGKARWRTYRYFSSLDDECLGQAIIGLIDERTLPCEQPTCQHPRGEHQLRLVHSNVMINIDIDSAEGEGTVGIQSWESCSVCGAHTTKVDTSDGTWLFSFAKFLELLVYSPVIGEIRPPLCDHSSKYNIRRHFRTQAGGVVFSVSPVQDVFELRVPRIQMRVGADDISKVASETSLQGTDDVAHDEKKALRHEMRAWWDGVWEHLQKLEEILVGEDTDTLPKTAKPLPRLPSADDAYEALDTASITTSAFSGITSASSTFSVSTASSTSTITDGTAKRHEYFSTAESLPPTIPEDEETTADIETTPPPSTISVPAVPAKDVPPKDNSVEQLTKLLHSLQDLQVKLYIQLDKTDVSTLNDVRRSFLGVVQGTRKRILAWKKKHLGSKFAIAGELTTKEPAWWSKGCHAVPGTDIIVRENDWGSIIAFTLSSKDYHGELLNIAFRRAPTTVTTPESPGTPGAPSSFFSVPSGYKFFGSAAAQPDPDQEDAAWNDMEPFSSTVTRKVQARDPPSILSIRDVLRKGATPSADPVIIDSIAPVHPLASTRAKADVQVSTQEVGGVMGLDEAVEPVEKLLHDLEHTPVDVNIPASGLVSPPSRASDPSGTATNYPSTTPSFARHARTVTSSSIESSRSVASVSTIGKDAGAKIVQTSLAMSSESVDAPTPPPKDPPQPPPKDEPLEPPKSPQQSDTLVSTASTFATNVASSLMRFVRSTSDNTTLPPASPNPPRRHELLNTDIESVEDRPHIKYDWMIGKRLKFSCTVYYAKQFDLLRRRCGIDDMFIKSLSSCTNWAAEGGKSKSNFWKTSDDRFIIKTLVNAWNVADLQFLIDIGPAYFKYMEATANKATVLAKLLGFYTIEIRNLETGTIQSKVDVLVMENLFYDQHISKTFDLKGIQGRKVKTSNPGGSTTKTFFDGEWIEGQQKALMLVQPHSKLVLQEAIRSDAEFLAKCNIMDYSLLLGVDETKKEICCGLVDTIGSYTFAKTIEYKAKHGLQSGSKEVTVIPPADYQERFVRALEGYFVACPDKWSKPLDDADVVTDPDSLPSVL